MRNPRRAWRLAFGTCTILAAGLATWALWPSPAGAPPQARRYLDVSACLLTNPSGIVPGTPGDPLWASMQKASLATHVMVSYLADTGPADVGPMINTLVQRRCGVIITASADPAQVIGAARNNPGQRFLLVASTGSTGLTIPSNAVVVSPANASAQIGQTLRALAAAAA